MIRVLGVDSSLANFGFALVEFGVTGFDVAAVSPEASGHLFPVRCRLAVHTTKGDDVSARLREHYRVTCGLAGGGVKVDAIGVEAQAYIPGKMRWSVIAILGRARQVVDDVGSAFRIDVVEVPAAEVARRAVDRPGKASKPERVAALRERFPCFAAALVDVPRESLHEHAADAFAVALAVAARSKP